MEREKKQGGGAVDGAEADAAESTDGMQGKFLQMAGGDPVKAKALTRKAQARKQGAPQGEVVEADSDEMEVVEADSEQAPMKARTELLTWLHESEDAIHFGLEDSLTDDICKPFEEAPKEAQEKVVDAVTDHVKEHIKELGMSQLKNAAIKGGGAAGKMMKEHRGNAATAVAKGASGVAATVMEAKELVDGYEEGLVNEAKAKTLRGLITQIQNKSKSQYGEYINRVMALSDGEAVSARQSLGATPKPMFERNAVNFWFAAIVKAKMIESNVYKGHDRVDAVQAALHPNRPGEGEGEK